MMKKAQVFTGSVLIVLLIIISVRFFWVNLSPEDNQASEVVGILPEANTKIAFIGDTGMGLNFKKVLDLIETEEADAVVHLGDFDYSSNPNGFHSVITEALGASYPYLVVSGNHDRSLWESSCSGGQGCYSELFAARYLEAGIPLTLEMLDSEKYTLDFQGVQLSFIGPGGINDGPEFAEYLEAELSESDNIWKICNWHFNQEKMQLGEKADQTGWEVYDTCLNAGAIIATAHEHSYHRTKSLIDFHSQGLPIVNPLYQDPNNLYVYPGSTFVFVSGLGGKSIRNQDRCLPSEYPYGCNQEWAKAYTSNQQANYGALFVEFNYDGNPYKARGYFKNIDNQIVDNFEITLRTDVILDTSTPTPEFSPTPSQTPTPTVTPSPTQIGESTPTPSMTITPTNTQLPGASATPVPTEIQGSICGEADVNGDGVFTLVDFAQFGLAYGNGQNTCSDTQVDYGVCGGRDVDRDGFLKLYDFGGENVGFSQRYYPKTSCAL